MTIKRNLILEKKVVLWGKPTLIVGGIVWIVRAGIGILLEPDYWSPKTAVDFTAVLGTSLSFFLLALGIWAIHLGRGEMDPVRKWVWRVGVAMSCGAAVLVALSNLFEDFFGIRGFGSVFVFSAVAVVAGLVLMAIGAIGARDISRWTGFLLFVCAFGWVLFDSGGGFAVGVALILLGFLNLTGESDRDLK